MTGLRLPDTPQAQNQKQRSTRLDRKQTEKKYHVCVKPQTKFKTKVALIPKKSSIKIQLRRSHFIQKKKFRWLGRESLVYSPPEEGVVVGVVS